MAISEKSIKILWANAAGRCSFPDCKERLTSVHTETSPHYTLGEMAHIKGNKKGSNRYDQNQPNEERDLYENLILLCPNHHSEIDKPENEGKYSVEWLIDAKKKHEEYVLMALTPQNIANLEHLKDAIAVLLAESYQVWKKYGPNSELAMMHPHSDELYSLWLNERLSTIVPNNRVIANLLTQYRKMFARSEQEIISQFLLHVNSYEKWVTNELAYQAVERFPKNFNSLIMGDEDASTQQ